MSYILDALKKSEAERTRDAGPTLLSTPRNAPGSRQAVTTVLIAVLALNAVIVGAWLLAPRFTGSVPAPSTTVETGQDIPAALPTPATVRPQMAPAQPPAADLEARPQPATTGRAARPPALALEPRTITPPSPPAFEISTHVYADDPEFRAITVDGRRLVEGDQLANGWTLATITETGIVMERNGERVVRDVLQDWHE